MTKTVQIVVGVVLVLAGVLFALQGAGVMGGSGGMNGKAIWVVIGPLIAVGGLFLIARARRSGISSR